MWQEVGVSVSKEIFFFFCKLLCFALGLDFSEPGFVVVSGFWEPRGSLVPVWMGTESVRPWAHWGPSKGPERSWRWGWRAPRPSDVSVQGLHWDLLEDLGTAAPGDGLGALACFPLGLWLGQMYEFLLRCFTPSEAMLGFMVCKTCFHGKWSCSWGKWPLWVHPGDAQRMFQGLQTSLCQSLVQSFFCWSLESDVDTAGLPTLFTYLSQHYFLSSQPGFITGPSFLKCKLFTAKSHLIIVQWHLSQNIAFPAVSVTCLAEPSDIFLHSFHLPALLEKQPDLHICLPHSAYPVPGLGWAADLCPQTDFLHPTHLYYTQNCPTVSPPLLSSHSLLFFLSLFPLNRCWQNIFSL